MSAPLLRQAHRIAKEADRTSAAFASELRRILRVAERELRGMTQGDPRLIQVAARRAQIRQVLKDLGYDALVDAATNEPLNRLAAKVLAGRLADRELAQASELRLAAMRSIHYLDLLEEGETLTQHLWRAVIRGTFATKPVPDLVRDVAKVVDSAESRIQTLYDTAVSIYGRQVEGEAAGDDPETPFAYMGPVDDKTRDFCLDRVGKVFTRQEIDEMDNAQIANVFLTGGGYNCRHVWQEVSKFSELYEKGEAPEVREEVASLKEAA